MPVHTHVTMEEIAQHCAGLEDPRSTINQRHPLISVVVVAIMAILAGATGPTAIAAWANDKKKFLLSQVSLTETGHGREETRTLHSDAGSEALAGHRSLERLADDRRGDQHLSSQGQGIG